MWGSEAGLNVQVSHRRMCQYLTMSTELACVCAVCKCFIGHVSVSLVTTVGDLGV